MYVIHFPVVQAKASSRLELKPKIWKSRLGFEMSEVARRAGKVLGARACKCRRRGPEGEVPFVNIITL